MKSFLVCAGWLSVGIIVVCVIHNKCMATVLQLKTVIWLDNPQYSIIPAYRCSPSDCVHYPVFSLVDKLMDVGNLATNTVVSCDALIKL